MCAALDRFNIFQPGSCLCVYCNFRRGGGLCGLLMHLILYSWCMYVFPLMSKTKLHLLIKMKLVFPYDTATAHGESSNGIRFTWVTIPGPATCDVKTSSALKIEYRSPRISCRPTRQCWPPAPCPPARRPADARRKVGGAWRWVGSLAPLRVAAAAAAAVTARLIYSSPEFFQR